MTNANCEINLSETGQSSQNIFIFIVKLYFKVIFYYIKSFIQLFIPLKVKDVKKQLVLVTGGANGLGRALAFGFARKGCNIAIVDIDIEAANATVRELRGTGIKAEAFKVH